jgi:hypothetical protein
LSKWWPRKVTKPLLRFQSLLRINSVVGDGP